MASRIAKPAAYNNNWLGNTVTMAKLQIINEQTNKWETVGECTDTPNALKKELAKKSYKGMSIWIRDTFGERRYHGLVK